MSERSLVESARRLRVPGYVILFAGMILPVVDVVLSVMPPLPEQVAWRFGTVGLAVNALSVLALFLFLTMALAVYCGDRAVILAAVVVAGLCALVLTPTVILFALDATQVRSVAPPQGTLKVTMTAGQAMMKLIFGDLAFVALAIGGFKVVRGKSRRGEGKRDVLIATPPRQPAR